MKNLILVGGGGHCKSVIEVIKGLPEYNIVGVLDPCFDSTQEKFVQDVPIIGNDDDISRYISMGHSFVVTVGQIKSPKIRIKLFGLIKSQSGKLPAIVAKTAYVSNNSSVADGTVVLNNAIINCNCNIGVGAIINSGAIIEHDCCIGDYCHIAPGTVLSGDVKVDNSTFIGANSVMVQGVQVGRESVIGAGSVVNKNVPNSQVWAGNPAQRIS
ncbi:NeuD/PglB/VioB family sugar acetyltransferase [Flagellimonas okinawensis]|uniref:NeuD/PglB/VioB family sugar acetyltransferase n=1 Tax=Flagellimonas okinawensis TaxID=3031324 RepID=A0ABT5XLU8_9FLAO|nr:NeuD/PglB/VioB family sugar acetyltransferase [[Muricauda] okinawensis]MDF0706864.1 NeuD/PglB/VioB family sugar acetyltransferase [[Muricauda] okinawensis]